MILRFGGWFGELAVEVSRGFADGFGVGWGCGLGEGDAFEDLGEAGAGEGFACLLDGADHLGEACEGGRGDDGVELVDGERVAGAELDDGDGLGDEVVQELVGDLCVRHGFECTDAAGKFKRGWAHVHKTAHRSCDARGVFD